MLKPVKLGFRSRLARWCFVALMAVGIVVPILTDLSIPAPAFAADCNWTSATSIDCGGTTYNESAVSGNSMTLSAPSACQSGKDSVTVNPFKTAKTATILTFSAGTLHAGCTPSSATVTIGNAYGSTPTPTTSPGASQPTDCNAGPGFTWLICGMIDVVAKVVDWIRENILVPMLTVPPLTQTWANGTVYKIWASFRNLSSIFFILVFFLIIFGTAIGFDNYTIKKILPRLIAGAILVSFSWYICVIAIDIGNVVGQGVLSLAGSIIPPPTINFNTGLDVLFVGGLLATAIAGYVIASLGLLVTILIAVVVAFAILVFRQIAITILVVLSPFALLAWILPNTERLFKLWWTSFIRLILMYPLVMLLFIAGYIFADIAGAGGYGGAGDKFLSPFLALVGLYGPLILFPMTLSWGGKVMSLGGNMINKAGSAANAKWGKDSTGAKERHERFQAKKAAKLADPNWGGPKATRAFTRSLARRQSGTGGFIIGNEKGIGIGKARIPGRQTTAQKLKQHEMGEKYTQLEGAVQGIEQYEHLAAKPLKSRINTAAAAQYDKMFAQGQAAALYSTRLHDRAARDEVLGGADKTAEGDAVQAKIDHARATGDTKALMEHLQHEAAGGLNHLEFHARQAAAAGDQVKLAAVMSRLSMSGGAQDRLQDIATGSTILTKDAKGNVRAVGGNGMNAVGTGYKDGDGFYHEGWKAKDGTVHETQAQAEHADHGGPGATKVAAYTYSGATHQDAGAIKTLLSAEAAFDSARARGAGKDELAQLGAAIKQARGAARQNQESLGLGAVLGGDFSHNVDQKFQDAWTRGTAGAKHGDFTKPQAAASTDYAASDLAGMHWSEVKRRINYAQNGDNAGAVADLAEGAAGVGSSKLLIGKSSSDAKRILGSVNGVATLNGDSIIATPEQQDAVRAIDQSINPGRYAPPPSTVSAGVAEGINSALGDAVNAGVFHSVIEQERAANNGASPTLARLENHVTNNNMAAFNQEVANATYAPNVAGSGVSAPAAGVQMSKEMYDQILKQTGNNFDETHKLVQAYHRADNDEYRARANQAFYADKQDIPSPEGPHGSASQPQENPNEEE